MTELDITAADAESLEAAFLGGLDEAQYAYERIVATSAWTALGFDSFAAWWDERVTPTMRALSMRPTREIAAAVVEKVREEEADLPPAQRRLQRELADMVGVERSSDLVRKSRRARRAQHGADRPAPSTRAAVTFTEALALEAAFFGDRACWQPASTPRAQLQQVVYFFRADNGRIKIGTSVDPEARLHELSTGSPCHIEILHVIPGGGRRLEAQLHRTFAKDRVRGEWFTPSEELIALIEGLRRGWVDARPADGRDLGEIELAMTGT